MEARVGHGSLEEFNRSLLLVQFDETAFGLDDLFDYVAVDFRDALAAALVHEAQGVLIQAELM